MNSTQTYGFFENLDFFYKPIKENVRKELIAKANDLIKNGNFNAQDNDKKSTFLHYTVLAGDVDLTNQIIHDGAEINVLDENYCAPLHYAVFTNNLDLVTRLIDAGADVDLNSDCLTKKKTALQVAVHLGLGDIVNLLLARGASIHHSTRKDCDATCNILEDACIPNKTNTYYSDDAYVKIIHLLLNHSENSCDATCINRAFTAALHYGTVDALNLFTDRGFDFNDMSSVPYHALKNKKVNVFKFIYTNGLVTKENRGFVNDTSLFLHAYRSSRIDAMKFMLKRGCDVDVNLAFTYVLTHVFLSFYHDRVQEALSLLLDFGADIHAPDCDNRYSIFDLYNDKIIEVLHLYLRQIVKLELTNRYVDPTFYRIINEDPVFKEYYDLCKTEFEKSKTTHLYDGISFFELFESEDIVPYAKNIQLVEALKNYDVESEFPIYHEILTKRVLKEIRRQERIKVGIKDLSYLLKLNENSQHLILQNVLRFLDKSDLKILRNI